jgi:hypothetical protein
MLVLFLAGGLNLPAEVAPTREYQVKAVFLFNFAQFAVWPDTAFAGAGAPFRIGILGDDPFGATLDRIVRGETVHGRPFLVVRSSDPAKLADCQVVFVSRSEKPRLAEVIAALHGRPVLTVADTAGFAEQGGDINLVVVGGKVRLEINPAAAREEGLRLSSQLLSVGKIVGNGTRKGGS